MENNDNDAPEEGENSNNNHHNNGNNENWDDDDPEDEDEEEEVAPNGQNNRLRRNDDGSYDGGVALCLDGGHTHAEQCDLILFLECTEAIPGFPNHPILKQGVSVAIGLDKQSKLHSVFGRYVQFCNEALESENKNCNNPDQEKKEVQVQDLDFYHVALLNGNDTSEVAALMKNDRVHVVKQRSEERTLEAERRKAQNESDKAYFESMRNLMPELTRGTCDVLFDCRGKLSDTAGLNQPVLQTGVRGHSAILAKRCKWLGKIIQGAREEYSRRSVVSIPDHGDDDSKQPHQPQRYTVMRSATADDEEENEAVFHYPEEPGQDEAQVGEDGEGATEIEIDDEDDTPAAIPSQSRADSPVISSTSGSDSMLWVTIPNHAPDALKLLLEYCYTNRVIPLGSEAFHGSLNPPFNEEGSAAVPLPRQWTNSKKPAVSFAVALAGISLAEEAGMARLSLMCEIAASKTIKSQNVVEALTLCTHQEKLTGNPLPILRQAAMYILLREGPRGVAAITRTRSFERALDEKPDEILPSLMVGAMEAIEEHKGIATVSPSDERDDPFAEIDRDDRYHREMERRNQRRKRPFVGLEDEEEEDDDDDANQESFENGEVDTNWRWEPPPSSRFSTRKSKKRAKRTRSKKKPSWRSSRIYRTRNH